MKRPVAIFLLLLSSLMLSQADAKVAQTREALVSTARQELATLNKLCQELEIDTLETIMKGMEDPDLMANTLRCVQSQSTVDLELTLKLDQLSVEQLKDFIAVVRSCIETGSSPTPEINLWKVGVISASGLALTFAILYLLTRDSGNGGGTQGGDSNELVPYHEPNKIVTEERVRETPLHTQDNNPDR